VNTPIVAIAGFSEPVSSLTHLIGAGAFAVLGGMLIARGRGNALRVVALVVYAVGVVFALAMSGVFHLLEPDGTPRAVLQRLDHSGIFFLIAATYTPIHVIQFRGFMRWGVLGLVWACAITGIVFKAVFFDRIPEWVGLLLYLGLGWVGIVSLLSLRRRHGWPPLGPLVWGALAYTAGAALEFSRWPVPLPGIVGPHELFHLFVLAGVSWHFVYIWRLVPVEEGA
jgi:channel protein (hemolysin III family)